MQNLLRAVAPAALLFSSAVAQPGVQPDPPNMQARLDAARIYVEGPAMAEMFDQMFSGDALQAQMRMMVPTDVDQSTLERMTTILSEELAAIRPEMTAAMVEAAADTFTLAELQAANAFYETPAGRGMASKTSAFQVEVMPALSPTMQKLQERIFARASEIENE
jgi:hypothetical protein